MRSTLAPKAEEEDSNPKELAFALGRLLIVFAAIVLFCIFTHSIDDLIVVLVLIVMVMLHELGHFATAKWSGMKVTEYFFGFGPKLWSVRRGETTYGIKAIPAGGYVKIVGMTMLEDVAPEDEARSYRQASFPRRLLVAVAGSCMHFILALILIWSVVLSEGNVASVATRPTVSSLLTFTPGPTPARAAGFRDGDAFVSINGHPTPSYQALSRIISKSAGKVLHVVVRRHGHLTDLTVTPKGRLVCEANKTKPSTVGQIGVELTTSKNVTTRPGVFGSIGSTLSQYGSLFSGTFGGLADVFSFHGLSAFAHDVATAGHQATCVVPPGAGTTSSSSSSSSSSSNGQILSFLGFIQIGSQALRQGVPALLFLLALVNLFIGVVNLFPMLPLDGGHVLIAVYERVRSRKGKRYHADVVKMMPIAYVFLAFIIVVGLAALYVNIVQPAHLPGG